MFRFKADHVLQFLRIFFAFSICFISVRLFEYVSISGKLFTDNIGLLELKGMGLDIIVCLRWGLLAGLLHYLVSLLSTRAAVICSHIIAIGTLLLYISLIITFSERNTPLDHELLTRSFSESWQTTKQMASTGFVTFLPFLLVIIVYSLLAYGFTFLKTGYRLITILFVLSLVSFVPVKLLGFEKENFETTVDYYVAVNKLNYFINDSFSYLYNRNNKAALTNESLTKEIDFYQQHQPFRFTSKDYPLLHAQETKDVIGSFFNLKKERPNIVLIVVEGLSRDFSGKDAYAYSFTPFLDSLAEHSLTWNNFLSTAPGTFAAHPAISGSLPYGKKGFSIMNVMPFHLSLIKFLKANGYYTSFMIGFNPDFDNMGGYIRQQGTDFILTNYPAKYKEMGVGEEGWSMGYPDDALYERSFNVLDSIGQQPYFNIYHTATTHMPYLFEQKPKYEKLFDKKLASINVSTKIRKTLKATKHVLTTFMFSDDCLRKFFADYSKRKDYDNTIFILTGDHHIGSFPSTGPIDDYHVPFIIYSPMLKSSKRFLSVNSQLNIAPTITDFYLKNYPADYQPKEVHWLGDVLDTSATFRNIHSMPFMWWSRDINDYLHGKYFLSEDQLYELQPNLLLKKIKNDSIKTELTKLRENFKIINDYVCANDKIYPRSSLQTDTVLLKEFVLKNERKIFSPLPDTALTPDFMIPKNVEFLYVRTTAEVDLLTSYENYHPTIRYALIDTAHRGRKYLYWSKRDIETLSAGEYAHGKWNSISVEDVFPLKDYKHIKNMIYETAVYTDSTPINLKMKNLRVQIYSIGKKNRQ